MKKIMSRSQKKESLVESLKLPKDICMGAIKVTMTGNSEAWIENYRGILEYTCNLILLQGKTCRVCFEGTRLSIDYYTNEDMKISGCIACVRYL
ncbi:MAG: sporulation protein [Lachnospiraceae bacterium]|jgi:sporulation protein YqfC|nr:sporulation protein [Lachnospiraceae bacterium]MCX4306223.1 YabP/YqfC family sporulation protein [Acetatifactor sp.]